MTARKTFAVALFAAAFGLAGAAEVAVAAAPVSAAAQSRDGQNRRVRVHNQTGAALQSLRAADVRTGEFGANLLGGSAVAPGSSIQVLIDDGQGGCLYDLRAELAGGGVVLRENVNVCRIADFYLTR
jgi:hypothetical protein